MDLIVRKLKKYNQKQLLDIYNNLNEEDKSSFRKQINQIDFKLMNKLYINSYIDEVIDIKKVDNLKCIKNITSEMKEKYENIGIELIKNNNYGVVIMAGGNASRLGLDKPKGALKINYLGTYKSLFEIFIDELKLIYKKYRVYINLYIMTSNSNDEDTKNFFEENKYFNYPKEKIKFFIQDNLPLLDVKGNILLKDKSQIWFVPNGNGNVFKSLKNNQLIRDMKRNNIKYCLFTGVDNPLTALVDFSFIGATIHNNYKLSSKTIYKSNALDLDWVFCKYNNKPFMLDDNHVKYFTNVKDNFGNFIYCEKNIMYHLISIEYIDKFSKIDLKYHRSYKKYNYIDNRGILIKVNEPNAFKFEQFIYDAFYYAKDMLLYRVADNEFCPIKTKEDIEKVEKMLNK